MVHSSICVVMSPWLNSLEGRRGIFARALFALLLGGLCIGGSTRSVAASFGDTVQWRFYTSVVHVDSLSAHYMLTHGVRWDLEAPIVYSRTFPLDGGGGGGSLSCGVCAFACWGAAGGC